MTLDTAIKQISKFNRQNPHISKEKREEVLRPLNLFIKNHQKKNGKKSINGTLQGRIPVLSR